MMVKIYAMIWGSIVMAAAIIFLSGNFSQLTAVVFGFISFGMIFMGMMGVLPSTIGHHTPVKKQLEKASVKEENKGFVPTGQVSVH